MQTNPLANASPDQCAAYKAHATITPANTSNVEFKESGESRRASTVARLIRATWGEQCAPASIVARGYLATGNSRWLVKCASTQLLFDYEVQIPEKSSGTAQVLQCYAAGLRTLTCTIAGRPA